MIKEITSLLLTDVPDEDLAMIEQMADRRGWSRVKMIRHILAQAAAGERRRAAEKIAADNDEPTISIDEAAERR